eukprot:scaffold11417_cov90-Isochrysis_galbana.AAC.2
MGDGGGALLHSSSGPRGGDASAHRTTGGSATGCRWGASAGGESASVAWAGETRRPSMVGIHRTERNTRTHCASPKSTAAAPGDPCARYSSRRRAGTCAATVPRRSLPTAYPPPAGLPPLCTTGSSGGSPRMEGARAGLGLCAGSASASTLSRERSAAKAAAAGAEAHAARSSASEAGDSDASSASGGSLVSAPDKPYGSRTDFAFFRTSIRSPRRADTGRGDALTLKLRPSAAPAAAKKERQLAAEAEAGAAWVEGRRGRGGPAARGCHRRCPGRSRRWGGPGGWGWGVVPRWMNGLRWARPASTIARGEAAYE